MKRQLHIHSIQWEREAGKEGEEEAQTWVCSGCQRVRPWSDGAADDLPDLCDDCWYQKHYPQEVVALSNEVTHV